MKEDYRFRISQGELEYTYEHAKARMKVHPEHAAKQKRIIREHPYFRSEKKALRTALRLMKKNNSAYQIWAKINKDEEYYRIQNYWLVSDNGIILSAAEYIGMAQIYTSEMLEKILRKNIDVDDVIANYQEY